MGYRENYQAWLRDFAADEQAVAELKGRVAFIRGVRIEA